MYLIIYTLFQTSTPRNFGGAIASAGKKLICSCTASGIALVVLRPQTISVVILNRYYNCI